VPAAVVDGLGDEAHEPDAAAAVHQVDAPGHLRSTCARARACMQIRERTQIFFLKKNVNARRRILHARTSTTLLVRDDDDEDG
jgi:hypothetical protein